MRTSLEACTPAEESRPAPLQTVYELLREGKLASLRIRGARRVGWEGVNRFVDAQLEQRMCRGTMRGFRTLGGRVVYR